MCTLQASSATSDLTQAANSARASPPPPPAHSAEQPHAYCMLPVPQSQPVLPCLLRRLLLQGDAAGAAALAQHHQSGPHFPRSLEWLLFTSLDHDFGAASSQSGSEGSHHADTATAAATASAAAASPHAASAAVTRTDHDANATVSSATLDPTRNTVTSDVDFGSGDAAIADLLRAVMRLIRRFPQWRDVVVNVCRKTDATMWPLLFTVAGRPSRLLEQLLRLGQVRKLLLMRLFARSASQMRHRAYTLMLASLAVCRVRTSACTAVACNM